MRKEGALIVANRELSEKQKEKVEKEINYMYYELYTKRMSAEAAQEIAKATYEKVKNEYELGKGLLSNEDDKNLREWIYGGIHEGAEIIKIITDFLPAGKAAYRDWETDRKSTRLNSSHRSLSRMPSSA